MSCLFLHHGPSFILIMGIQHKCTSRWRSATISALKDPQTVCIDKVPYHVRDLCFFPYNPMKDKITTSGDNKMNITVGDNGDGDNHLVDSDLGSSSDGNDNEGQQLTMRPPQSAGKPAVLHLRQSNRQKMASNDCHLNNDDIRGECSGDSCHPLSQMTDLPVPADGFGSLGRDKQEVMMLLGPEESDQVNWPLKYLSI